MSSNQGVGGNPPDPLDIEINRDTTFDGWWEAQGWTAHDEANPHAAWTYDDLRETAKEAWDAGYWVGWDAR